MITLELIPDPLESLSLDVFDEPLIPINNTASDVVLSMDMATSSPLTMEMVSGGIVGDPGPRGLKGEKGDTTVITPDVDSFDPGDLTLIFENKLI